MQPRRLLVTILRLIAGTVQLTAHAQSVGAPNLPAAPVLSAGPVQANPIESEVTALQAKLLLAPVASSPIVFYGSSSIRLWKSLQQVFEFIPEIVWHFPQLFSILPDRLCFGKAESGATGILREHPQIKSAGARFPQNPARDRLY